jgi:hypothetical protein
MDTLNQLMQVAGLSERHPGQAILGQRGRVEPDPASADADIQQLPVLIESR